MVSEPHFLGTKHTLCIHLHSLSTERWGVERERQTDRDRERNTHRTRERGRETQREVERDRQRK